MPSLHLTTPGLVVRLESERLQIVRPVSDYAAEENGPTAPLTHQVHLWDIERVFVTERVDLSMGVMGALMRRGLPVILLSNSDQVLGLCQPPAPNATARARQYRFLEAEANRIALASAVVEAKILNQRRVLQRLATNRPDHEITPLLLKLKRLADEVTRVQSIDTLRGYEGTSAGQYFEAYGAFFPARAPFERRSRRPPHNAVNAILSFTYTLLCGETEAGLHAAGLDPAFGFFHEPAERRPSLALDLIEPMRAPLADAMALDLISHGTLHPENHFEPRNGGVYLNQEGRRRLFVAYERRMERDFLSQQTGLRTSLRGEIERMIAGLKKAVLEGEMFEPFVMN